MAEYTLMVPCKSTRAELTAVMVHLGSDTDLGTNKIWTRAASEYQRPTWLAVVDGIYSAPALDVRVAILTITGGMVCTEDPRWWALELLERLEPDEVVYLGVGKGVSRGH